jgi:hypothetical protein
VHALNDLSLIDNMRVQIREGSLFYVSGVQENIPLKLLRGWTCCYQVPYSHQSNEKIFDLIKGDRFAFIFKFTQRIIVGAR